jgi:hypothetical protein
MIAEDVLDDTCCDESSIICDELERLEGGNTVRPEFTYFRYVDAGTWCASDI